jgi:hypothetical protein
VWPVAYSVNAQTVRHPLQEVGERWEEEWGEERELHQFDGTEEEWAVA